MDFTISATPKSISAPNRELNWRDRTRALLRQPRKFSIWVPIFKFEKYRFQFRFSDLKNIDFDPWIFKISIPFLNLTLENSKLLATLKNIHCNSDSGSHTSETLNAHLNARPQFWRADFGFAPFRHHSNTFAASLFFVSSWSRVLFRDDDATKEEIMKQQHWFVCVCHLRAFDPVRPQKSQKRFMCACNARKRPDDDDDGERAKEQNKARTSSCVERRIFFFFIDRARSMLLFWRRRNANYSLFRARVLWLLARSWFGVCKVGLVVVFDKWCAPRFSH